ncbi:MraY family glycosyltransferase [Pyrococcus kukulkanii]|uniref:UDP-N-acetylglucosamine--dolichyl-phosphate N-acetylglucosaminephosphotransferase n=1 Tax=Pyrococcus kukulkanii TaxID=1609559 RepID=A0A127B8F0_9EURY|nr:glycosyltransferase 4 family protein [Pyrococcus kukulkanii]AMM53662.1 UDP-N-acetylglucosamine--dolichyl-phosphate N-acetylglucosaminephosphotransferase [Pyrococcus kukulkanii]
MIEAISLILSLILTHYIAKAMMKAGIAGRDVHKPYEVFVPEMGGLAIVFSILLVGLLTRSPGFILIVFALVSMVGILDDLSNLPQSHKVILSALATFPIMLWVKREYVSLGEVKLYLGLITPIVFWLYTIASANLVNMLAGFNGLEVGTSAIIFFFLYLMSGSKLSLIAFLASLGFLWWNKYPAKVFPGDTGTLSLGALMALIAIENHLELPLAVMLIPHAIDFMLKIRVKFKGKQIGRTKVREDGTLTPPPYLSFLGLIMRVKKVKEWELVLYVWGIEIILGIIGLSLLA